MALTPDAVRRGSVVLVSCLDTPTMRAITRQIAVVLEA
jgi:hypothetical protein